MARRPCPRSVDAPRWCRSPCRRGSAGRSRLAPVAGPLPCNPRRCRRSTRRRPAGRRHPSARGSWSCARHVIGRWPGVAPPFSTGGAAMGLHGRTVDQKFGRRFTALRQRLEQARPDAFRSPAPKPIVERLARTIRGRRILPPCAPDSMI